MSASLLPFIATVTHKWEVQYSDPLELRAGDIVTLGEIETEEKWKGWIKCATTEKSGWVPFQIIKVISPALGFITTDYSAKELKVVVGDKVEVRKILNEWLWVKLIESDNGGWIPEQSIHPGREDQDLEEHPGNR